MIVHAPHELVKLSSNCTVSEYRHFEAGEDRDSLANFIKQRFEERYLNPIDVDKLKKNGFTIMAVSCLMIEALESFSLGWPDSKGRSRAAFRSFFSRWQPFSPFQPIASEFFDHVRCGILHQAETTGGWRIRRSGPLLQDTTINATRFVNALRQVLNTYSSELRRQPWDHPNWIAFRLKMNAICSNTKNSSNRTPTPPFNSVA